MKIRKLAALLLCCAFIIFSVNIPLSAQTQKESEIKEPSQSGQKLDIKAESAFLMEPHSGKILYEDNADKRLPPASITKIMSLLLVTEALDRGDLTLETVITASEHACSLGGSQIWLEPGETMTVHDLLKATVIVSANDATVALAEAVAGSEESFVALMNEKAAQLGMNSTEFINCTGLDADGHLTTAHDVGLMASALIKHSIIKKYSTVWMDTLRDGQSELVNTNRLIKFYKGATGLKTGTTSKAGYCLAATAERDGMELVSVIMGGESSKDRFSGAAKLLDFGFANFAYTEIKPELPRNYIFKVKNGTKDGIGVTAGDPFGIITDKSSKKDITQKTVFSRKASAPIGKGELLGEIKIYIGNRQTGAIPITAAESVQKLSFFVCFSRIFKGLFTV